MNIDADATDGNVPMDDGDFQCQEPDVQCHLANYKTLILLSRNDLGDADLHLHTAADWAEKVGSTIGQSTHLRMVNISNEDKSFPMH